MFAFVCRQQIALTKRGLVTRRKVTEGFPDGTGVPDTSLTFAS